MASTSDIICIVIEAFMILGLIRNAWVFKKRMKALRYMGSSSLDSLPSYNTMMLKFWIWDINKLIK